MRIRVLLSVILFICCCLPIVAEDTLDTILARIEKTAERVEREGKIDSAAMLRREKISLISRAQKDSLVIIEAPKQMRWMEEHNQWTYYYRTWRLLAEAYYFSKRPQTALFETKRMLEHAQQHNNNRGRAIAYQQMGFFYLEIDNREAIKAYKHSIDLLKGESDDRFSEMSRAYGYLCEALDNEKEYASELSYCNEWQQLLAQYGGDLTKMSTKRVLIELHLQKAGALMGLSRLQEADEELTKAEQLNKTPQDSYYHYLSLVHRAHLAMLNGNIEQAVRLSDAYVSMMANDDWKPARLIRGEILMKANRSADAARLYRSLYEQQDSTFARDMRIQLDEFNTIFQLDEIRAKGQQDRQRFIIGIALLILVTLFIIMLQSYRSAKKLEEKNLELKDKNRQLTIANTRAEESSRMKTDFIHQISHEIRTPLNILSGFTQVITTEDMTLDDATRKDISQRITENTNRITELVNKMLELSEASSHSVIARNDDVLAIQIATQAADEAQLSEAPHVTFDMQVTPEVETVMLHTDQHYAIRALTLLLDNARKFTKDGKILLSVDTQPQRSVRFTVEDTGIGIPLDEAQHIFEEFVQLDENYDGTGIGLTVARSIARRLDGDIILDTSYTGGARFIMTLPLS